GADDLDPGLVGLLVGLAADKGGQKRVVDVDDPVGIVLEELRGEYLHVPGKDDKVDLRLLEQGESLALLFELVFFRHRQTVIGDPKRLNRLPQDFVIADDERDLGPQITPAPLPEELQKTVVLPGDKDRHALDPV